LPGRYKSAVAVKTLKENATASELSNFMRELQVMKSVEKHENIVSLLGCCVRQGPVYMIVEFAKHGNLRNYLRARRPKDYMLYSGEKVAETLADGEGDESLENVQKLYSR